MVFGDEVVIMKLISGTTDFQVDGNSAITIGKFDGIHRGHQMLLDDILRQKIQGYKAVVVTFDPPPSALFGKKDQKELTTKEEKREMFRRMGVDVLVEYPMNMTTAAMSPEDFVKKVLVEQLHTKYIAAGVDISFGHMGSGKVDLLEQMGRDQGFEVVIIDKLCAYGKEISSTFVRSEVEQGNMEKVTDLLGAPYSIAGIVQHGKRIGRTMGMPTVNQIPTGNKLLPPFGVYFSDVLYQDVEYKSITNIGIKPTVTDERIAGVETHIFNFSEDLYGKMIEVRLLKFCRKESKFNSLDELVAQLQEDLKECRNYHNI